MGTRPAITKKATNVYQTGSTWANVANMFDSSTSTYSYARNTPSVPNSASYIDGFDFSAIPDYAIIDKVEVHTRFQTTASILALSNPQGYCCIYIYSKTGSNIGYEIVANGESKSSQEVVQTYTGATLQSKLNSLGIYNGSVVKFVKEGMRVRIVGGGKGTANSNSAYSECRIYDNYITVYYSIPDITYTYKNYDGTVLKTQTVEQGTSPTPPSNPTRPSTAEYSYTFSGWSLSGTTYTAQYTATKRKYTISVSAENGNVSGAGTYEYGTNATLTANPNEGYVFTRWTDGNTDNPRTVNVTGNATYTANFEADKENNLVGTTQVNDIYVGTQKINVVCVGTTKV